MTDDYFYKRIPEEEPTGKIFRRDVSDALYLSFAITCEKCDTSWSEKTSSKCWNCNEVPVKL